jgi:hypothetical protein
MSNDVSANRSRDFLAVLAVWLLLAVFLVFLAWPNTSAPGLYYDEAECAGMAKDFLTGHSQLHMPGSTSVNLWGRPFPTFAVPYIGGLKSWLLMPSFAVFGTSLPVLRLTALGWGLGSLLLFMLWTWRWLGRNTALLAGTLLALDPTFLFTSVLDWGLVLPSFLCRFTCFYFGLRWWQLRSSSPTPEGLSGAMQTMPSRGVSFFRVHRSSLHAFLAGLFAGLGFFSKIDFAVLLLGMVLALLCANARKLATDRPWRWSSGYAKPFAVACVGFLVTAGPMLIRIPYILKNLPVDPHPNARGVLTEKLNTMLAMYDGSYFYRLMNVGGAFDRMFQTRAGVFAPIGIVVIVAAAILMFRFHSRLLRGSLSDVAAFPLLALLFITIGIFFLPGAVRMHHMVLVYPFPHLVVALAVTRLWRAAPSPYSVAVAALVVLLLAWQIVVIHKTQQLIRQTGGRGLWSDAIGAFARDVNGRSDLEIVSMDWGFNEQLAFLTDGPMLSEPFWSARVPLDLATNCVYLVHPPDNTIFPSGLRFLEWSRGAAASLVEVQPWRDHQGQVAFYSIRFRAQ